MIDEVRKKQKEQLGFILTMWNVNLANELKQVMDTEVLF